MVRALSLRGVEENGGETNGGWEVGAADDLYLAAFPARAIRTGTPGMRSFDVPLRTRLALESVYSAALIPLRPGRANAR
ncbi:hypothetical protein SKAU_G00304420 [Synaphobranchus kaupii]|uniref:Uncharacterized protein n=1 Tax=Synaphobranchus kaupii TaxID=118154 RepID=A0A9Q1EWD9_SYNKA|nr:hypothetical protein SKAU_G00304420 [Synaphobranchus kaupii]